ALVCRYGMQRDPTSARRPGDVASCFIQKSITDVDTHAVSRVESGMRRSDHALPHPTSSTRWPFGHLAVLDHQIEFALARRVLKAMKPLSNDVTVELAHLAPTPIQTRQPECAGGTNSPR